MKTKDKELKIVADRKKFILKNNKNAKKKKNDA